MAPTLADGEFVLVDPSRSPRVGDLVVAIHPRQPLRSDGEDLMVVKRVGGIEPDGRLSLYSDNPEAGTDSRTWGPVDPGLLVGTVTVVLDRLLSADLKPPER